jgi:thioredoxin 1
MKKNLLLVALISVIFSSCQAEDPKKTGSKSNITNPVIHLTNESFKQKIFNYESGSQWKYAGETPAIIDFYADWCAPCRQLSPVVEELAKEYGGKIVVYKVDTDKEQLLSQNLGIQSLPTLLLIPAQGDPRVIIGVLPKEQLVKAIQDVLLVKI